MTQTPAFLGNFAAASLRRPERTSPATDIVSAVLVFGGIILAALL